MYKDHPKRATAHNVSFSDWIQKFDELPNYYCKFYDWVQGGSQVLGKMDYIIDTKNINAGISKMLADIGVNARYDSTHINSYSKPEITNDDVNIIKDKLIKDIKTT